MTNAKTDDNDRFLNSPLQHVRGDYITPRRADPQTPLPHIIAASHNLKYLNNSEKANKANRVKELDIKIQILKEILRFKKAQSRFLKKSKQLESETGLPEQNKALPAAVVNIPQVAAPQTALNVFPNALNGAFPKIHVLNVNSTVVLSDKLKPLTDIVVDLMNHVYASAFNAPVDYVRLNLPDYPLKILAPMDLGTVKMRLENGGYKDAAGVISDIRQVWINAQTYNPPGNQYNTMARILSGLFEKRLSDFGGEANGFSGAVNDIGFESKRFSGKSNKPKTPHDLNESDYDTATGDVIELSIYEKNELKSLITGITDPKVLDTVVSIIRTDSLYQNMDSSKKLDFNVNSLSKKVLRVLYKFVGSVPGLKKMAEKEMANLDPGYHLKQIDTKISNEFGIDRSALLASVKNNSLFKENGTEMENNVGKEEKTKEDEALEKYCAKIIESSSSSSDPEESDDDTVNSLFNNNGELPSSQKVMWNWKPDAVKNLKTTTPPITKRQETMTKPKPNLGIKKPATQTPPIFMPANVQTWQQKPSSTRFLSGGKLPPPPVTQFNGVLGNREALRVKREMQNAVAINLQQRSILSLQKRFE